MTDTLLPCPFCGSTKVELDGEGDDSAYWYVSCDACTATIDTGYCSKADAIAAWNRRAPQPAPAAVPYNSVLTALELAKKFQNEHVNHGTEWANADIDKVDAWLATLRGQRPEQE